MWRILVLNKILFIYIYVASTLNHHNNKKRNNLQQYINKQIKPFIKYRDHDFVGEDSILISELDRRITKEAKLDVKCYEMKDTSLPEELTDDNVYLNRSLRRTFINDPKNTTLNLKIIDMMRQAIYATQLRLEDLDQVLDKYRDHVKFRVAYMFRKLDAWLYDTKVIWSIVTNTTAFDNEQEKRRLKTYKHYVYYATMLRRNIDITYLVEELIRIQENYYLSITSDEE